MNFGERDGLDQENKIKESLRSLLCDSSVHIHKGLLLKPTKKKRNKKKEKKKARAISL